MVVIDDVEAFKMWLIKKLTPLCDADPNALTKYVVALVKKDKSESALINLCQEQLVVFLQKETDGFVKDLFEVLHSKSYLPSSIEVGSNEAKAISHEPKGRELHRSQASHSPLRRPRSPDMRRHYDDRRYRRRSPAQDSRRYYGRRPRSKSSSPRRRGHSSTSPVPHRRNLSKRSPRRSRSPVKRKRSKSLDKSSSSDGRSSSVDSNHQNIPDSTVNVEKRKKERCWDYDQKGFCMKGDSCPFDHGSDALVVNDLTMSTSAEEAKTIEAEPKFQHVPIQPPILAPPRPLISTMPLGVPPFPPPHGMPPMSLPPPSLFHRFPIPINVNVPPPQIPPPLNNPANVRKRPADNGNSNGPGAKRSFYNNNTGSFKKALIVKKIPVFLNNITKLNEHFAKFGAINNIQVKYNSHPDEAVIEFAHATSARAAIKDASAVMDNRFIRVYWHNNVEAQQTNTSSSLNAVSNVEKTQSLQPSYDETNAAAMKEAENKGAAEVSNEAKKKIAEAREALLEKTKEKQKLYKQKLELQKQQKGLVQKQLEQQKLLLAKLSASKHMPASEKVELMKTIKALTSTINSTRNLSKKTTGLGLNQEKQKQPNVLDSNEVGDSSAPTVTDETLALKKKLNLLKSEASSLGIVPSYRGGWGRGRGRGRGRGNHHRFIRSGANLDRRPCELRISGFSDEDKEEIVCHFASFGEIEKHSFDEASNTCDIKYKARHDAEQAAFQASMFKGRKLTIAWTSQPNKLPIPVTTVPSPVPTPKLIHSPAARPPSNHSEEEDEDEDISVVVEPVVAYTPEDDFGYELLEDDLDEEALLTGDIGEEDINFDEEHSWKH